MIDGRRDRLLAAVFVLTASLGAGAGQSPQNPPQQPAFRGRVDIVQIDVSVIDRSTRTPVLGLTAADFEVLEDGRPQKIEAFVAQELALPTLEVSRDDRHAAWLRTVPADIQNNSQEAVEGGRLFVLVIDDAMIPLDPWVIQQSRKAATRVIERLAPTDRMAVVLTASGRGAQDFTNDRAKLLTAAGRMNPGLAQYMFGWDGYIPPTRGAFQPPATVDGDIQAREMSAATLANVADALLAAPERRKTVIYLGPGIPINPGMAAAVRLADGSSLVSHEANKRLYSELPELFRRMQRANINVYALDPTGIAGMGAIVAKALTSLPAVAKGSHASVDQSTGALKAGTGGGTGAQTPDPTDFGHFAATMDVNFLLTIASNTGGLAIVNTDDLEPGIEQMFRENGSYYLLGYRPPPGDKPGSLHRLTVRVNRPNVDVRTRNGYYTPEPEKQIATPPLSKAISALLPVAGFPMNVGLAPFGGGDRQQPSVLIVVGMDEATKPERTEETVELSTRAFPADGGATIGQQDETAHIVLGASARGEVAHYQVLSSIRLNPGRYQLRIAAHRKTDHTIGSVFTEVEIPDFAGAAVSLSGVVFSTVPAPASAASAVTRALVPVVPTTSRTFDNTAQVSVFVRVYQRRSGSPSAVTFGMSVTDSSGTIPTRASTTVAPTRFQNGFSADYQAELPLAGLKQGTYLLTLEAAIGKSVARRDVRFAVK